MVKALHTAVAGRARFKVEGLYRSEYLEKLLESRLARLQDISLASANALTGNVLVCYNTSIPSLAGSWQKWGSTWAASTPKGSKPRQAAQVFLKLIYF